MIKFKYDFKIRMLVEGYQEISQKELDEGKDYYVRLQTSYIDKNDALKETYVKVKKRIDFKSLIGKSVECLECEEYKPEYTVFYVAHDAKEIDENIDELVLDRSMILNVYSVNDKLNNDNITDSFIYAKNKTDKGRLEVYKIKVKETKKESLLSLKGKNISISNISTFLAGNGKKDIYYSIENPQDNIKLIK